jgi:hypothetical protein
MEVGFGRMMSKRVIYVQTNQGLVSVTIYIINCRTDSNPHIIQTLSKYVIKNKQKVGESTSKEDKKTGKKAILPTKSLMLSWIIEGEQQEHGQGKWEGTLKGKSDKRITESEARQKKAIHYSAQTQQI